jgi:type III pantothenate kinase
MKLLLDIGNTRVKWAWLDGGALGRAGEIRHRERNFAEVAAALPLGGPAPDAVLAASVAVPALNASFADVFRRQWGLELTLAVTERSACGVENGYAEPRQLGVDRWLAILAAYDRRRGSVCVVDAGTAVTIDLVQAGGQHLGGLIVPGLQLMQQTLHRETGSIDRAARLLDSCTASVPAIGRDTAACVRNGALLAVSSLVRHCVTAAREHESPAVLVMTGGDAPLLLPVLANLNPEHRPSLVLEGLALRHGLG